MYENPGGVPPASLCQRPCLKNVIFSTVFRENCVFMHSNIMSDFNVIETVVV